MGRDLVVPVPVNVGEVVETPPVEDTAVEVTVVDPTGVGITDVEDSMGLEVVEVSDGW